MLPNVELDTFTSDFSNKISHTGGAVDIHKAIGTKSCEGLDVTGSQIYGQMSDHLAVQLSLFAGEISSDNGSDTTDLRSTNKDD